MITMRRVVAAAALALLIGRPAAAQFSFRTTGEEAFRIFTVRPTASSLGVPPVSAANHVKFWVPDTGHAGYSAGNIYISQNGGAWSLLSSFVGAGAITSVFGRTGTITAQIADYDTFYASTGSTETITGAWNLGSLATATTPSPSDNDTSVITSAWVKSQGYTTNVGTVASVALSAPSVFSVSGSPITSSGTLTLGLASQSANLLWASPNGSSGAPTFRALASGDLPANGVTNTVLRDSSALSLIGRSANSSGDPADIAATATSGAVLRESGSTIGFGTVATAGIADDAITDVKLRNSAATSVIGRSANSTGDPADIACTATNQFLWRNGTSVACATAASTNLSDTTSIVYDSGNESIAGNKDFTNGLFERGRSTASGTYTTFTPTLSASTGTFSCTTTNSAKYSITGKKMSVTFIVSGCSVSATPSSLTMTIPGGFTSQGSAGQTISFSDNSVAGTGWASISGTTVTLFKTISGSGTWATASGTTIVGFSTNFEIQ